MGAAGMRCEGVRVRLRGRRGGVARACVCSVHVCTCIAVSPKRTRKKKTIERMCASDQIAYAKHLRIARIDGKIVSACSGRAARRALATPDTCHAPGEGAGGVGCGWEGGECMRGEGVSGERALARCKRGEARGEASCARRRGGGLQRRGGRGCRPSPGVPRGPRQMARAGCWAGG